jgi:hypothetical protein
MPIELKTYFPPAPVITWPTFCTSLPTPEMVLQPAAAIAMSARAIAFFMLFLFLLMGLSKKILRGLTPGSESL